MAEWISIIPTDKLPQGERKLTFIGNTPIAVFHLDDGFYAIKDYCPHLGMPLGEGSVGKYDIACPFHGAVFNLKTGEALAGPTTENLHTYPVRIENGEVQINFSE